MPYTNRKSSPGKLDRIISRGVSVDITNALNEKVSLSVSYTDYFAAVRHSAFNEKHEDSQQQGIDIIYFIVRYDSIWFDRVAHIKWENEKYDVLGARQIDRRHYIEIKTQKIK